jgi:hypothetical protein
LTEKCFPLTNFSNGKQTQESLESGFISNLTWNKRLKKEKKKPKKGEKAEDEKTMGSEKFTALPFLFNSLPTNS